MEKIYKITIKSLSDIFDENDSRIIYIFESKISAIDETSERILCDGLWIDNIENFDEFKDKILNNKVTVTVTV